MNISVPQSTTCGLPGCLWSRTTEGLPSAELLGSEDMRRLGLPSCNTLLTFCLSQAWVERIAESLPWVKALQKNYSYHSQHYIPSYRDMPSNMLSHLLCTRKKKKRKKRNPKLNINRMQALFMH